MFYGIINENAAKYTHLTDDDVNIMLDGIWNGTKSLISRTKAGQVPRLLLKVNYSKENYHIGDLDRMLKLVADVPHEKIRSPADYLIDLTDLVRRLIAEKASIKDIEICADDCMIFTKDGQNFPMERLSEATGIVVKPLMF
jgi:CRISPR-associated protein Csh2